MTPLIETIVGEFRQREAAIRKRLKTKELLNSYNLEREKCDEKRELNLNQNKLLHQAESQ